MADFWCCNCPNLTERCFTNLGIRYVLISNLYPNFSILCLDILDRNIFDDAWNGIQDTVNGVVSGARLAGLLANCNSPLRQMVSDFNADFIDDFKNMKDQGQVFPYFGNGLSNIGEEFGQLANNLDDLASCMKGSIFGRTYEPTSKLQLATTPSAGKY